MPTASTNPCLDDCRKRAFAMQLRPSETIRFYLALTSPLPCKTLPATSGPHLDSGDQVQLQIVGNGPASKWGILCPLSGAFRCHSGHSSFCLCCFLLREAKLPNGLPHKHSPQEGKLPSPSPKLQKELGKATAALQANRLEEAQRHLDEAYRLAPGNPEVNYIRGLLADRQGKLAAAQASWEKTLSLDPKHGLTLQALATIMARKGDYPAAKGYLDRALQVDANSWRAHELLAIVCFRQSDFTEAVNHAERSLELGKNLANGARLPLAESLIAQNQTAPATEVLHAFLDGGPPKEQAAIASKLLHKLSVPEPPQAASPESNPIPVP